MIRLSVERQARVVIGHQVERHCVLVEEELPPAPGWALNGVAAWLLQLLPHPLS